VHHDFNQKPAAECPQSADIQPNIRRFSFGTLRDDNVRIVFVRNEAGDVAELILVVEGGAELHAPKVE